MNVIPFSPSAPPEPPTPAMIAVWVFEVAA
jgi:hypothetical protein